MKRHWFPIYFLLCGTLLLTSCAKPIKRESITLTQAQQKFLKICREEVKINPTVIPAGKTVWIYVPMDSTLFDVKAANKNSTPPSPDKTNWTIQYLDSAFKDRTFVIRYDIAQVKRYDKPLSYQNKLSDTYSRVQREVLTAITRAYFDIPNTILTTSLTVGNRTVPTTVSELTKPQTSTLETPPEFFVMIFVDIKRGVGMKSINYFSDMKMAMSSIPGLTPEEFNKRYVYEIFGDEDLIGDQDGSNLKVYEMTLAEFLAKQIENRIKLQFTQSSFPPDGAAQDAIWHIVAETCRLYNFLDFDKIKLIDLPSDKESLYDKNQL